MIPPVQCAHSRGSSHPTVRLNVVWLPVECPIQEPDHVHNRAEPTFYAPTLLPPRVLSWRRPPLAGGTVLIAPVIPPSQSPEEILGKVFAIPPSSTATDLCDIAYSTGTLGPAGRISDKHILRILGWRPGTRVDIRCGYYGVLTAHAAATAPAYVSTGDYFRIPFRLRHAAHLEIGNRVLMIAYLADARLAIYPPQALQEIFGHGPHLLEADQ